MSSSSLQTVSNFVNLLDGQMQYQAASNLLVDDFKFLTPRDSFHSRSDWLKGFPKVHKDAPIFEDPVPGSHDNQVLRNGKKKLGFLTINLVETYELNDDGKITQISAARA